jgi:glutathione synthase/RimK-type ligase-like ATP-grasp enzyme
VNKDVLIFNNPSAIREKNEKLYVNEFQGLIPDNIVSADEKIIKEFLFEKKEIIL